MISFRFSVIALSATLMFSVGSSASTATTNYSHPDFSVADGSTLNLRETGSQIVVETIENALRQGGLALLGEGFQLDSSLIYHSGDNEGIEGDLDVVVPLWNGGRHAIFTQPGFVFWKGLEGEERFDGNIGLVYRAELTRGLIAGASVFYDHDFQIGHSRVSGGLDLQSGYFRLGANYYHPLSEVEDGREGFVEEALSGMDARLVFEREAVRLGSTIGYWDYKGEESGGQEDSRSGWKTSTGLDFGIRILPGVFAEASWERHKDNIVLDERIFAGLAFRFSLPDFQGASYGSGEMTSNLYKIVDREKRILYEERVGVPSVSIVYTGSESVAEGDTVEFEVRLSEALTQDVTLNLVGTGSAMYGSSNDWTLSVDGTPCTGIAEDDNCQVVIAMGETSANVTISIVEGESDEPAEDINLSMGIVSTESLDLRLGGSILSLSISADLPEVSLNYSGNAQVGRLTDPRMTIDLSQTLSEPVTLDLIRGGTSSYGAIDEWFLQFAFIEQGETIPDSFLTHGTDSINCGGDGNSCQVTIPAGITLVDILLTIAGTVGETIEVSIGNPSANVQLGDSTRQELTLQ